MRLRLILLFLLGLPGLGRADAPNPSFYLVNRGAQPINEARDGWVNSDRSLSGLSA